MAGALLADPNRNVADICRTLGVSRSTLYRLNNSTHHNKRPPAETMHPPVSQPPIQTQPQKASTPKQPKGKISAGTKAFIRQMAENLNTHDPDKPKGRLKKP